MAKGIHFNRRQFIGTTASAAGGLMLPLSQASGMHGVTTSDVHLSTPHFWYRKPANNPYVDSQNMNMAFAFTDTELLFSEDNSHTWSYKIAFSDAKNITYSHIFNDGTVLFGTRQKLYLCERKLKSYKEIIIKDTDGQDYIPHTPKNPDFPGWYFLSLSMVDSWIINGKEMLVWGNCANVIGGATPQNIYYSVDKGQTVKIAYTFGQNPHFTDNGSRRGGQGGTPLGDPDNPLICRHIHWVAYNPVEDAFYACTGDIKRENSKEEVHWLRGTYDADKDKWAWKVIITDTSNSRYKAGGITFVDGQMYWISDANSFDPNDPMDRGIFRCDPADIANKESHTMLYNTTYESVCMIIEDGVILATHIPEVSPYTLGIIISPDMGKSWFEYDIKDYGHYAPLRIHKKNDEGWFRMDLRTGWVTRSDYMFLKPKYP